jgi:hypothetical protein
MISPIVGAHSLLSLGRYSLSNGVANSVNLRLRGHWLVIGDFLFLIASAIFGSWFLLDRTAGWAENDVAMVLDGSASKSSALDRTVVQACIYHNPNNGTKTYLSEFKTKLVNGRSRSLDMATLSTMDLADKEMAQSAFHL